MGQRLLVCTGLENSHPALLLTKLLAHLSWKGLWRSQVHPSQFAEEEKLPSPFTSMASFGVFNYDSLL